MKCPRWISLRGLTVVSLVLNLAFVADHLRRGTFQRLFVRMDLAEAAPDHSAYQQEMEARYRNLPEMPDGVVFAGDSLIFQGPWSEFYSDIHNRGIPNETSALLLGRLDGVTGSQPRRVVLLTGANDLNQGVPVPQLVRNYRSILEKIRSDCPTAEVTVLGLLPIDPSFPTAPRYDNSSVLEANRQLKGLVGEFPKARFLDLTARLADESGKLRRGFTEDGLHLTLEGYLAVREAIQGLLVGPDDSNHPKAEDATRAPR